MRDDGQVLVNLGLIHRDNEWQPYWQGWLDWMRGQGWRRFGLYVWDQGAGMPGDWDGRLAPAFELVFHFNRQARKPNKIVPCKTAGEIGHAPGTASMRRKDGSFNTWTHGGEATQPFRIPDSVIRIERHHGAVGTRSQPPGAVPGRSCAEHIMRAFADEGEIVYEPFCGSGTISSPASGPAAGCGRSSWRPSTSTSRCCAGGSGSRTSRSRSPATAGRSRMSRRNAGSVPPDHSIANI